MKRLDEAIARYENDRRMYLAEIKITAPGPLGVQIVAEIEDWK